MELPDGIFHLIGLILGWPLRLFRRWLDRQPHRDVSQISTLHKIGRLVLASVVCLLILVPLGWLLFG